MARVLVTGSADGVGHATARAVLDEGHDVDVHVRNQGRRPAVDDLVGRGAGVVVGDLADLEQIRGLADQANALGSFDAVVHNAGAGDGRSVLTVNVVAPYLLTALVPARRLVYLSSSMHRGGRADIGRADWSGLRGTPDYSDSKLLVTMLMAAVARRCPDVLSNAVDPGWVPTRMGGASAPDDLSLAHVTQCWLATSDDPAALVSGEYWHHRRVQQPHRLVHDERAQDELLASLAAFTGVELPHG